MLRLRGMLDLWMKVTEVGLLVDGLMGLKAPPGSASYTEAALTTPWKAWRLRDVQRAGTDSVCGLEPTRCYMEVVCGKNNL